jgi:hypothetical protein
VIVQPERSQGRFAIQYTVFRRERSGMPWVRVLATSDLVEAMDAMNGPAEYLMKTVRDPIFVGPNEDNTGEPRRPKPDEDDD